MNLIEILFVDQEKREYMISIWNGVKSTYDIKYMEFIIKI